MNVKYVYQEDLGYRPGSARNLGIRAAEGRICVMIDAGVLVNTDCLRQHIRFYNENGPGVAAIGYVYGFDRTAESEDLLKKLVNPEDAATSIRRLSKNSIFWDIRDEHYFKHKDLLHELPATWFYFWTCHVSAARQDLLDIGLFDPAYDGRWGVEDNELGYRLQESGVNIHLLRAAEAIHYPHAKEKEERRLEGYQNCLHFYNKYPVPEVKLFLDTYLIMEEFVDINAILKKSKKFAPLRQTA
jgi:GT2 family glycosyltransferase